MEADVGGVGVLGLFVAFHRDFTGHGISVREDVVFATVLSDEAETFLVIEELRNTICPRMLSGLFTVTSRMIACLLLT